MDCSVRAYTFQLHCHPYNVRLPSCIDLSVIPSIWTLKRRESVGFMKTWYEFKSILCDDLDGVKEWTAHGQLSSTAVA